MNIFFGLNGSGKTNLLEAIFLLCLGRSQRGMNDAFLLKKGDETYRVEGVFRDNGVLHEVSIAYSNRRQKRLTIDGVKCRLPELYDSFSAVAIGPEDSELLAGPPSARRHFLDLYISQLSGKYLNELSRYYRILSQKNAALKEGLEFQSYDSLLIKSGSVLMKMRQHFLQDLETKAKKYYQLFSKGSLLAITYVPSVTGGERLDEKMVESRFEKCLDEMREKEIIMKTALIGPHRDEVDLFINGLPARTYGSQGEWRSAAIAMKLTVFQLLKEKKEFAPLLLLDEVFAELDEHRVEALINSFADFEQLFLTTATKPPTSLCVNSKRFQIEDGQIVSVT